MIVLPSSKAREKQQERQPFEIAIDEKDDVLESSPFQVHDKQKLPVLAKSPDYEIAISESVQYQNTSLPFSPNTS